MSKETPRREVIIGAAAVATAAALPIAAMPDKEALFAGLLKQPMPMAPDPDHFRHFRRPKRIGPPRTAEEWQDDEDMSGPWWEDIKALKEKGQKA